MTGRGDAGNDRVLEWADVYREMLREYERRGLTGDVLLRWAAWRVSHGGPRDASDQFLLMMADVKYLARVRVRNRKLMSEFVKSL